MHDEILGERGGVRGGRRYRRPLLLSIAASMGGEALLLLVYGVLLNSGGDLWVKVLWTVVFCGLGMGSVVGALTILIVVDRWEGLPAILATSAIMAAVMGGLCNVLCYRLDSHYFHYFGAAEQPLLFLAPGIVLPALVGALFGWLMFTPRGRLVLERWGI